MFLGFCLMAAIPMFRLFCMRLGIFWQEDYGRSDVINGSHCLIFFEISYVSWNTLDCELFLHFAVGE